MKTYSLVGYAEMLADDVRRDAYVAALEAVVQPGHRVLEIGTGPGFFALHATRLGAQVTALETSAVVALARRLAESNGLGDRIDFVRTRSDAFQDPQQFDVVVSDLRSVTPLEPGNVAAMADARRRLLRADGHLMPTVDRLWATVVDAEDAIRNQRAGFADRLGLDLALARRHLEHAPLRIDLAPEDCLTEHGVWATIDYRTAKEGPIDGVLDLPIVRDGTAHGIAIWFETELLPEAPARDAIGFDCGPDAPPTLYRQLLLPFPDATTVAAGECSRLRIDWRPTDGGTWRWQTEIGDRRFDQSTFEGTVFDPETLRRRAGDFVPQRLADAEFVAFVLTHMDGERSSQVIAERLRHHAPDRFSDPGSALTFVADLVSSYAR